MMQDGLHIGLAAWIHAQRNTGGFPVYPALPIVTGLVDLEAIQDVNDLTKAAEFARLVNFVPRQGQVADTFSASAVLWQVHHDILGDMDHATEALTRAERAEYQAARNILYMTDAAGRPAPSDKLLLYEEMKNAYRDLYESGGSAEEIAQAMADWMVQGFKQLVEDALETIVRVSTRSSRNQAQDERALLEPTRLRMHGDMSFASTYFAPISAIVRETWMKAKVSFDDLDGAVGNSPASGKWKAYRANRTGEVVFDYVVLNCLRPWYTPALYQADDWRLKNEGTVVSRGNGTDGLVPAYVDTVYLVSVKNVTNKPQPPGTGGIVWSSLRKLDATQIMPTQRPRPVVGLTSLGTTGPRKGVVTKAMNTPIERMVSSSPGSVLASTATDIRLAARSPAEVRRLTAVDLNQRYRLAQEYLVERGRPTPTPAEDPTRSLIHVAGFGCEKIPFAPNPNVNYKW